MSAYAFWHTNPRTWPSRRRIVFYLLIVLLLAGFLAICLYFGDNSNDDMEEFFLPWYQTIVELGGWQALGSGFSNYTPPYTYLLVAVTYLDGLIPPLFAIKLIPIVFDFLAAWMMFRLARLKYASGQIPWAAFFLTLYLPTVIMNGPLWGQVDIVYTFFLLGFVYFICRQKPLTAMTFFAVAVSFKLQAVFLAPLVLALLLKGRIPWGALFIIPAVYLLLGLPEVLAGRPLLDVLAIYINQGGTYRSLSKNAANLYLLMPEGWYQPGVVIGLTVAVLVGLALAYRSWRAPGELTLRRLALYALTCAAVMPFVLPKMHDRYFFPADVFSLAFAFIAPRYRILAIMFQAASLITYVPYYNERQVIPLWVAVLINTLAIGWLVYLFRQDTRADSQIARPAAA